MENLVETYTVTVDGAYHTQSDATVPLDSMQRLYATS